MNKRAFINQIMFYVVVILLLFFCLGFFFHFILNYRTIETYAEGPVWTVHAPDGTLYTDVDLSNPGFRISLQEGEHLYLYTNLDDSVTDEMIARVYIRQAGVHAYVNGETVYKYMSKTSDRHAFVGSGYQFILIPDSDGNRQIQFDVIGSRGVKVNSLPTVVITRTKDAYTHFLSEHMLVLFCGIFLLILGIIVSCISVICFAIDYEYYPLVIMGVIGILGGLWSVSNVKALELFSLNMAVNTYVEYVALYLLPLPVLQFIAYRHEMDHRKLWPVRMSAVLVFLFAFEAILLHGMGVVLITDCLSIYHVLVLIAFLSVLSCGLKPLKELESYEYFYMAAFAAMVVFSMFYILRFQVMRLWYQGTGPAGFTYLAVGLLVFEMLLLFGYLSYMHSRVISRAEHAVLEQLAYEDRMTGLCNRAKGEILMRKLDDRSLGVPYAIVNFDMNGLKRTNDALGHFAGDDMLVKFSEILTRVFRGIGTPVRMSGDEFIVIVRGKEKIDLIDNALRELAVQEANASLEADYVMDAAYGVAYSMEFIEPKAERVYGLADKRMFEMKTASKKGRE